MKTLFSLIAFSLSFSLVVSAQDSMSLAGLVLSQDLPRNDRTWYFCPNGNLQMTEDLYPEKSIHLGSWTIQDDKLIINLNVNYGKRGVGEPWVKGNIKGFNEYSEYVHQQNEEITFNLSEIQIGSEGEGAQFEVVKTGYTCPAKFYTPELPGKYPVASYRLLTEADLDKLKAEDLSIMKYEIYARYGCKFSGHILNYFVGQEWYFGTKHSVTHLLTNIEKRNIKTIEARERLVRK